METTKSPRKIEVDWQVEPEVSVPTRPGSTYSDYVVKPICLSEDRGFSAKALKLPVSTGLASSFTVPVTSIRDEENRAGLVLMCDCYDLRYIAQEVTY